MNIVVIGGSTALGVGARLGFGEKPGTPSTELFAHFLRMRYPHSQVSYQNMAIAGTTSQLRASGLGLEPVRGWDRECARRCGRSRQVPPRCCAHKVVFTGRFLLRYDVTWFTLHKAHSGSIGYKARGNRSGRLPRARACVKFERVRGLQHSPPRASRLAEGVDPQLLAEGEAAPPGTSARSSALLHSAMAAGGARATSSPRPPPAAAHAAARGALTRELLALLVRGARSSSAKSASVYSASL